MGTQLMARAAARDSGWVLRDVGPFGDMLEPVDDVTADELHAVFLRRSPRCSNAARMPSSSKP
jgi:hypothetical protein